MVEIWHRSYLSSHLLWAAQHEAELAGQIEASHKGRPRSSVEHRAYVLSSVVASANFLEAMVNELYQDAADGYVHEGGYIDTLSDGCRAAMTAVWRGTDNGRSLRTFAKYDMLLSFAGVSPLPRDGVVYSDAKLVSRLRNAVVHYRPRSLSAAEDAEDLHSRLAHKFEENVLYGGTNTWWPDRALGYGAATWAHHAARTFADTVCDSLGIVPNYLRHVRGTWFEQAPGSKERARSSD